MKSHVKKSICSLLALATALPIMLAVPAPVQVSAASDVTVDLSAEKQVIRGFGGMNHSAWAGDLTPAQRETAFGNGNNQLGLTVLRIPIDENKNNWKREVATAKKAIENGAIVFATPWNPPSDMVESFTLGTNSGTGTTYEAETGTTLTNAKVERTNSGYTGTGYVKFQNTTNSAVQFNTIPIGSTGMKNLKIRYALPNGTSKLDVYVNGARAQSNVPFEATGGWSTWGEKSIQVSMANGTNTLKLVTTGTEAPIIDNINITAYVESKAAKRLRYDKYDAYAKYLNEFDSFMKNNGVNLYAISVQNEPDYAHDWTWWSADEILRFMKENAGSINNRVMAPESFSYVKAMSDKILNDPQALANMDILGTHTYGTRFSDFSYPLFKQKGAGKELWMTEVYYPNSEANSADRWPEALDVSYHIHNAMVEGDFQAYVWWYIRRQYSPMNEDSTISKRGYNMAHFSKFVRPGYVRVDATKNPAANIYTSAYKGDNKVVIVAINKSASPVSQNFTLKNGTASTVSSWVTDGTRNLAAGPKMNVVGSSFTAQLPAQSVTTFVAELGKNNNIVNTNAGTTYEAEKDTTLVNSVVESTYSESNNFQFVNFNTMSDASIQWNSINCAFTGSKNVKFRYALDKGTRYLDVYVNGAKVMSDAPFEAVGSWGTWGETTVQLPFKSGVNTLKVVTTGTEGPNIDKITVSAQ